MAASVSSGASSAMKWPELTAAPDTLCAHRFQTSSGLEAAFLPKPGFAPHGQHRRGYLAAFVNGRLVVLDVASGTGAVVVAHGVDDFRAMRKYVR
jgi:hypothetical protein